MQFELILAKQELRLVLTRFSLWRLLQNHTRTTSFSRWRPFAIRAISWEDGLLFSTKLCSRASLAPRLDWESSREREKKSLLKKDSHKADLKKKCFYLIVVLLFLFRSFIPILSLFRAEGTDVRGSWISEGDEKDERNRRRVGSPRASSASSNHLARMAFSLQAFLKLSCRFSKRQMVVWLNSEPCTAARASPTLVWV